MKNFISLLKFHYYPTSEWFDEKREYKRNHKFCQ